MATVPAKAAAPDAAAHLPRDASRGVTSVLLNIAHALDHLVLLVFATAVSAIALDFGLARWEDLMPYATGAFVLFGIGSLPAGRLGDLWGRRAMMLVFFFGLGASSLLCALTQSPWQIAAALTLLGAFSSIYHPVGIPMLVQRAARPGFTIGVNGLSGNLGVALAALSTGLLVKYFGWRAAFVVPGLVAIACGFVFAWLVPTEASPPSRRPPRQVDLPPSLLVRVFLVITITSCTGSLIFNFTTNGNAELIHERMAGLVADPAMLGALLAGVYAIASLAQVTVGRLIDRHPIRRLYLAIALAQVPMFLLAAHAQGWAFYALAVAFMVVVFGAIPFTDALIVRYVDDRMRSRVAGVRLAVSFGISSLAVLVLGPAVKASGFASLLTALAVIATCTALTVLALPRDDKASLRPTA